MPLSPDPRTSVSDFRRGATKIPANPWPPLLWGVVVGVVAAFFPFFRFFARTLSVFIHEVLGHTAAYWFVASPTIPAPNLFGETGFAWSFGFSPLFYGLWLAVWAWLWAFSPLRASLVVKIAVPAVAAVQALLVFSGWTDVFGISAGHAAEAFWAFALALWAAGKRHETPVVPFLAALAAGALAAGLASTCAQIIWSPSYRDFYLADNGGMNDLVRLAGVSKLSVIAAWYLAAALLAAPSGLLLGRWWRRTLAPPGLPRA